MVHFYDKNRKLVMKLYDFSSSSGQEPTTIKFSVDISYLLFKAFHVVEDYKVYFESFLEELNLLYENKRKIAQFSPIEMQLEIYFKQVEYGHIDVRITLNDFHIDYTMYQSTLTINYSIDQSFLPELMREISIVLKSCNDLK
jgi:hypothetical protein